MPNNKSTKPVLKSFSTIKEGCAAFGLKPEKRGWITLAGARFENAPHPDPTLRNVILWFPNTKSKHWNNVYNNGVIIETPKDETRNAAHVEKYLKLDELRITFLKDKKDYRFVGVFRLNSKNTKKQNRCIWECVLPAFTSDLHEIKDYLKQNP